MEHLRIRLKWGNSEIEAEGSPSLVKQYIDQFWQKVDERRVTDGDSGLTGAQQKRNSSAEWQHFPARKAEENKWPYEVVFDTASGRRVVRLTRTFSGELGDAKSSILILHGFSMLLDRHQVPVTLLRTSLELSGIDVDRIDRTVEPGIEDDYIGKSGVGKGTQYHLTDEGSYRAEEFLEHLKYDHLMGK